jgi:glycosyltransferase involved in cell wall biosynthesis
VNVLLALPDAPFPPVSGGHWRDWQMANLLTRAGHTLHLLLFATARTSTAALQAAEPHALARSVAFGGYRLERPDGAGMARTVRRKLSYVFAARPAHPQAFQYDAINAGEQIVQYAGVVGADAVVIRSFWCRIASRLKAQGHLVIADCPDDNTALTQDMVALTPGVRKLGPWANHVGVRRHEQRLLPDCDEVWVPTASEAAGMRRRMALPRVLVVPNLLDVHATPDYSALPGEGDTLLFVANFDYAPNARGAERLLDSVLPLVRRDRPHATVTFVGGGITGGFRQRAEAAGCTVSGHVAAVAPYNASHELVTLPVAEGAGMLVKAVEGLAFGRPVTGLAPAFRGMPSAQPEAFVSAPTSVALASGIIELLRRPERRLTLGRLGRRLAEDSLSWSSGTALLERSVLADTHGR